MVFQTDDISRGKKSNKLHTDAEFPNPRGTGRTPQAPFTRRVAPFDPLRVLRVKARRYNYGVTWRLRPTLLNAQFKV